MQMNLFRWVSRVTRVIAMLAISGCVIPGAGVHDDSLGYNGSFEIQRAGLPVNWSSSRYPIRNGDAEFTIDTADAVSGEQSLKIVVRRFSDSSRWKPFLFQVREAEQGKTYAVKFWLKCQGCRVLLEIGNEGKYYLFGGQPEAEKQDYAAHPRIRKLLDEEEIGNNEWRQFQYHYTVPETDGSIRFELKLMRTGTLWIDDVRIQRVEEGG